MTAPIPSELDGYGQLCPECGDPYIGGPGCYAGACAAEPDGRCAGDRCSTCGACASHAGCADSGPAADGSRPDCPDCGACPDCAVRCAEGADQ